MINVNSFDSPDHTVTKHKSLEDSDTKVPLNEIVVPFGFIGSLDILRF